MRHLQQNEEKKTKKKHYDPGSPASPTAQKPANTGEAN